MVEVVLVLVVLVEVVVVDVVVAGNGNEVYKAVVALCRGNKVSHLVPHTCTWRIPFPTKSAIWSALKGKPCCSQTHESSEIPHRKTCTNCI